MEYNFKEVEKKWQSYWQEKQNLPGGSRSFQAQILRVGYVSLPIRGRVTRGTPARLHRFRHLFPLQTSERIQCPASHGI